MWNFNQYDQMAIISDEAKQITYKELLNEGQALAHMIGDRCLIFILCTNEIGCIVGYTTCLNHHIVPLMLDSSIDLELLAQLMEKYRPKYLWVPQINSINGSNFETCYQAYDYKLVRTNFEKQYPLYEELALLLTTSGSTGSQKLVRQSYENIRSNTDSIIEYLKINKDERPVVVLPMSYTYGLSIINTHLAVGATILLTSQKVIQKSFWKFFDKYEATSFSGVPYTYQILKKLNFLTLKRPSLKTLTQAGGKLSLELQLDFAKYAKENHMKFVVMYGQTEATARISYLPHEQCLSKVESIGIPIPGGQLSLVGTDGKYIDEVGVEGELVYRGNNVTLGYATCGEDLGKGDERGKVLSTGDIAYRDQDGYYYISGRKNRYVKVYGKRVSLDELESLLKNDLQVEELACTGVEDCIRVFITESQLKSEVKTYLSKKTGFNKSAFQINIIDQIPRNSSGKVKYQELI